MRYEGKEEKEISRDQIKPPEGWIFKDEWKVDMNRAVDEEGRNYVFFFAVPATPLSLSLSLSQAGSTLWRQD